MGRHRQKMRKRGRQIMIDCLTESWRDIFWNTDRYLSSCTLFFPKKPCNLWGRIHPLILSRWTSDSIKPRLLSSQNGDWHPARSGDPEMSHGKTRSPVHTGYLITREWKVRAWWLKAPALESERPGFEVGSTASSLCGLRHGTYTLWVSVSSFLKSRSH